MPESISCQWIRVYFYKKITSQIIYLRSVFAAVAAGLIFHGHATGAEIFIDKSIVDNETVEIILTGEIKRGDEVVFAKLVGAGKKKIWLHLESTGGHVDSAIAIGSIVRKHEGVVLAGKCYSACVLIFAGGVIRTGARAFDEPVIGVHRIFFSKLQPGLTVGQVKARYDVQLNRVRKYLAEVNVVPELLSFMQAIEPSDMRILTRDELNRYGLGTQDVTYNEFLVAERAAELGISSFEYRSREQRGREECKNIAESMGESTEFEREMAIRRRITVQVYREVECSMAIRYGTSVETYRQRESQVNERCRHYIDQTQQNRCQMHFMSTGRAAP
jgi:hypothetical protein